MEETLIEKAIASLNPVNYEPMYTAHYVTKNDDDMAGSDYCKNCIAGAVKKARAYHKEQRDFWIKKFDSISKKGYYYSGRKKIFLTLREISKHKRAKLKYLPAKASFKYQGHDPDFGGGLTSPCCCDGCGEYFQCSFTPDKEEAEHLLYVIRNTNPIPDVNKWELQIALENYNYANDDAKKVLDKVIKKLIK